MKKSTKIIAFTLASVAFIAAVVSLVNYNSHMQLKALEDAVLQLNLEEQRKIDATQLKKEQLEKAQDAIDKQEAQNKQKKEDETDDLLAEAAKLIIAGSGTEYYYTEDGKPKSLRVDSLNPEIRAKQVANKIALDRLWAKQGIYVE